MTHIFGEIINHAFGIMLSPVPIASVILILLTNRAGRNGFAYVAGWMLGLGIAVLVGVALAQAWQRTLTADSVHTHTTVNLVLGGIFLIMAVVTLLQQPAVDEEDELPAWAQRIDDLKPVHAAGLGFAGSALTPKNLLLTLSVTFLILTANVSAADAGALLLAFFLLASLGILTPVAIYCAGGSRSRAVLERWKVRLVRHRYIVLAVVFFMMGIALVSSGLQSLP